MNYLAHLHLGGPAPHQLLGSLYGDFVKGPLDGRWPQAIEAGIRLHRRIDLFTDTHPLVRDARALFPAARRRVSGILLDLFFDHCLARDWADYAEVPLPAFTGQVYRVLADQAALPGALARIAPRMAEQDWLGSYREFDTLAAVVGGMSRRLSRPELLAGGFDELAERYQPLSDHFRRFYPELQRFAAQAGMA
ncbi:ACP phosphodiesterase [Metapseudomonas otitidis]|uniref:acyl carrier protein phosphodiesterase n=1 Tax=Metapseudomonas otitidis TaxID=319939 RepID=UPI00260F22B8|nr:ACP phosphodiesterase [Pseudomonas otitidis]